MISLTSAKGFADPVFDGQRCFRAVMNAMAHPAQILPVDGVAEAPAPLSPVAAAVAITLFDQDTPVWLDPPLAESPDVCGWLTFHTGAPVVTVPADAIFAVAANVVRAPAVSAFAQGSDRYPDRSTTLVLQVDTLDRSGPCLSGPGIPGSARLGFDPAPANFWSDFIGNRALFPRGVDVVLAGSRWLAALPRSIKVEDF